MLQVGLLLLVTGLVSASQLCQNGMICPEGSSCCETLNGYECCRAKEMPPVQGQEMTSFERSNDKEESPQVRCDSSYVCPGLHTCCRNANGGWGCCRFSQGVCCSDGLTCCRYGTTCGSFNKCVKGGYGILWAKREPAVLQKALNQPLLEGQ
ncbi:progranulin-like [Polypterus senegalus]|uniref:progranulin-like n=1 Tax=Polypterus senegalus TaxID=55291 RepID=UPI0019667BB5|nr:progranulin-like [Polypterus senegalus]